MLTTFKIVTCLSWLWRHVACILTFILSDKEEVFCFAKQLKRILKNTSSERDSRSYGHFRRHRSRGDLRNKSKRRSITMHSGHWVWQSLSCQKVCCTFSVLLCCFLLFSRLVHCRRRVLELANNVTSLNNSWYATISLKNQGFEGKRTTKTTSAGTAHREALLLMHVYENPNTWETFSRKHCWIFKTTSGCYIVAITVESFLVGIILSGQPRAGRALFNSCYQSTSGRNFP